jgi:hypothetical protein
MPRPGLLAFALVWLCPATGATQSCPGTLAGGGHVAYGVGGAAAPADRDPGFRHHLDLSAVLGPGHQDCRDQNGVIAFPAIRGPLFGASGLIGFASPSYAVLEAGYGSSAGIAALGSFAAVGMRLTGDVAPVAGLRGNVDLLLVDLGLRVLASIEKRPELGIWVMVGLGQF